MPTKPKNFRLPTELIDRIKVATEKLKKETFVIWGEINETSITTKALENYIAEIIGDQKIFTQPDLSLYNKYLVDNEKALILDDISQNEIDDNYPREKAGIDWLVVTAKDKREALEQFMMYKNRNHPKQFGLDFFLNSYRQRQTNIYSLYKADYFAHNKKM
jgi:hypothetical protein